MPRSPVPGLTPAAPAPLSQPETFNVPPTGRTLAAPTTHRRPAAKPTRRALTRRRAPNPADHPADLSSPHLGPPSLRAARSLLPRAGASRVKGGPQGHRRSRRGTQRSGVKRP
ncbi:hypothetical protein GCM10010321_75670 [Streptomyces chartreusis]|nr:hypothetical protein GCM10010321_75670 [Streptomyces chartreusis]